VFQLTSAHLQALDAASDAHYRQQLVADLTEFAPRLCEVAGQQAVDAFIDFGLQKAEGYQLTLQGSIRFYLELMASFGWRFDEDPQYQGLIRHLPLLETDEETRLELMYNVYSNFFDTTIGERNQLLVSALKRLVNLDLVAISDSREQVPLQATQLLTELYPEKAHAIGLDALQQTITVALQASQKISATDRLSQCTWIVLSFFLGIGFYEDPLYAWVRRDAAESDGGRLIVRIRNRAIIYAKAVIDFWENN